jgi:phage protein D
MADPADVTPHVTPTIVLDGSEISDRLRDKLVRTLVDTHLHLPDMFEITFDDSDTDVIGDLSVKIGSRVEIYGGAPSDTWAECLIKGEVTAIEGDYEGMVLHTIVRGYERAHRMQRFIRTRAFMDMTDSDIASQIADAYNFSDREVDSTGTTHKHISQVAQTDWDFLKYRAQEIGYEVGVAGGTFFFRKPSGSDSAGSEPPTLTLGETLLAFHPRVSAGGLTSDVEVRVWDPKTADVVVGSSDVKSVTANLSEAPKADEMAGMFKDSPAPSAQLPRKAGAPSLGPAPSKTARVVSDRPVDRDSTASAAVDEMAKGVAEHVGSTFAEAEGSTYGNPDVQAGKPAKIEGVPGQFRGTWIVTNARHTFVPDEGGYRTSFVVSGRQDRSLLGLATLGRTNGTRPMINGFVCGVVTNNSDPDDQGRVKLAFPAFTSTYESDWARVVQFGMGKQWGALFTPEVGDEVLVGFEFNDARRPYVLGGLINGTNQHDLLSTAVAGSGPMAHVAQRGIVTPTGNRIILDDDQAPAAPVPNKSAITISDKDGKMVIVVDKKNGAIQISADSTAPPSKITIEQKGTGGEISVKAAGNVSIEAAAPGQLSLKGGAGVSIDAGQGMVEVTGSMIKLG